MFWHKCDRMDYSPTNATFSTNTGYFGKCHSDHPSAMQCIALGTLLTHWGQNIADDIFICLFLNKNVSIPIKLSLKFVPKGPINNIPPLVQIMAWHRQGDKPLFEPMMVSLLTHICVTQPQSVNTLKCRKILRDLVGHSEQCHLFENVIQNHLWPRRFPGPGVQWTTTPSAGRLLDDRFYHFHLLPGTLHLVTKL